MSEITFKCEHCGQELTVDSSAAGSEAECPSCNKHLNIPMSKDPPSDPKINAAPEPKPVSPDNPSSLDRGHDDTFGMQDGGDLGVSSVLSGAKSAASEFRTLDYSFLMPFAKLFSRSLLRKKAVRWVLAFGLFPLVVSLLKHMFGWSFAQSAWFIGGYFCFFWAAYFHGVLKPEGKVWRAGIKWAAFTVVVGLPVLFAAQTLPIIKTFYAGTESGSFLYQCIGYVFGVGVFEETCKALPLILFCLRKNERLPLKNGIFYGMMSGFGFALAEAVDYSIRYWNQSALTSAAAITEAVQQAESSSNFRNPWLYDSSYISDDKTAAISSRLDDLVPSLMEYYGDIVITQIVRFMTLPLLHAVWAGVVGWFIAVASRRPGKQWPIVVLGIVFMAVLHGMYDVFSSGLIGIALAAMSILVFMGYLMHGEDESPTGSP